jgi:FkbM family methyltransferase
MRVSAIGWNATAHVTRRLKGYRAARILRRLHNPTRSGSGITSQIPLEDGLRISVNTASAFEWDLFFYGPNKFEPQIRSLLRRSIRPGHAAIDVGANIGIHTLVMARAAASGPVLACEPNPSACARLSSNVTLNRLRNVIIRPTAVSDRCGTATLFMPLDEERLQAWASLQHNEDDPYLAHVRSLEVPVITIDELVDRAYLHDIDVIKIDVEGMEGAVMQGARRVLRRWHPLLLFEYTPTWWAQAGYVLEDVLDDLRHLGYRRFLTLTNEGCRELSGSPSTTDIVASH